MTFTDMNRIAYRIGDTAYADLAVNVKERLLWTTEAVESALSLPPWNFRLSTATVTEFLPRSVRSVDDYDLADYETQANGTIVPIDADMGTSSIQLSHTPVLLSGLVVYEDMNGFAGQGSSPFPAATLLTVGVDYFLDCGTAGLSTSGKLHRIGGAWTRQPRSIKVTYKGGPAAQVAASLGPDFADVYEECVAACVLHNYSFWEQQRKSHMDGKAGRVENSESIGKYSRGFGAPSGTVGGSSFAFGGSAVILPEELLTTLSPFVNLGALFTR